MSAMYNMDKIKISNHLLTRGHKDIDKNNPKFRKDNSFKNSVPRWADCCITKQVEICILFMTNSLVKITAHKQLQKRLLHQCMQMS